MSKNYTRPGDPDHVDKPEDWLNSSLIFARALSLALEDNTGVVVKLVGEMKNPAGTSNQVIVFKRGDMIYIEDADENVSEGTWCKIIDPDSNLN